MTNRNAVTIHTARSAQSASAVAREAPLDERARKARLVALRPRLHEVRLDVPEDVVAHEVVVLVLVPRPAVDSVAAEDGHRERLELNALQLDWKLSAGEVNVVRTRPEIEIIGVMGVE